MQQYVTPKYRQWLLGHGCIYLLPWKMSILLAAASKIVLDCLWLVGCLLIRWLMPRSGCDRLREYDECLFSLPTGCTRSDIVTETHPPCENDPDSLTTMHICRQNFWEGLSFASLQYPQPLVSIFEFITIYVSPNRRKQDRHVSHVLYGHSFS